MDPYFCTNCYFHGEFKGVICLSTTCEVCGSLYIVPKLTAAALGFDLSDFRRPILRKPNLKIVPKPPHEE
jgi:hypothetical protein